MVIVVENGYGDMDQVVWILHCTDILQKGMNQSSLSAAGGK